MADPLARVKVENVTNAEKSLDTLLANEELLSMQQVAEKLDLPITRAYDLLQDRKFIAWDSPEGKRVPLAFFNDKGVIAQHVPAAITVLTDGGYKDTEIFKHLFTEDDSLPGRPIDALHGHLAREVIRRAQAAAF